MANNDLFAPPKTGRPNFAAGNNNNLYNQAQQNNNFDVNADKDLFAAQQQGQAQRDQTMVGDAAGGEQSQAFKPQQYPQQNLYGQTTQAIGQQMQGQVPGFQEQANIAREAQRAQQQQAEEQQREAMFGAGLADTGQRFRFELATPAEQARERAELERGLTADRGALQMQQQQQGIGNALTREGMQLQERMQREQIESTEKISAQELAQKSEFFFADLDQRQKEFAQEAVWFDRKEDFDRWALQKGIDADEANRIWQSSENAKERGLTREISFAQLGLEEQKLAMQSEQFVSKMDFDKWAKEQDLSENEKNRIWQANENARERTVRLDIANMQNDTERWKQTRVEDLTREGWTQKKPWPRLIVHMTLLLRL
jgi:hypothetical protein